MSDLHGIHRLASDATVGITDLVEAMHHTDPANPGRPWQVAGGPHPRHHGIRLPLPLRGVTRLVGGGLDVLLERFGNHHNQAPPSPEREAVLAALNGVLGDFLVASGDPLALPIATQTGCRCRFRGTHSPRRSAAGGHLRVLVHGLCRNHLQWTRGDHDHGAALARDLGCTPVSCITTAGGTFPRTGASSRT